MISLWIVLVYFILQLKGYIVSLGGYKFHVSPLTEDIEKNEERHYFAAPLAYVLVALSLVLITGLTEIILYAILFANFQEAQFVAYALWPIVGAYGFFLLFTIIYIPIAFNIRKAPKAEPVEEPKKELPKEE